MNLFRTLRLALMMFVQFFIWGSWATTLSNYMVTQEMGGYIAMAFSFGPIACIVAPFFVGMVADRFFNTEKVLAVLFLLAGVAMALMPSYAGTPLFLILLAVHTLCYFPTLGLTSSLAFHHIENQEKEFPVIRVFGTIGWIVTGLVISWVLAADSSATPMYLGGGASLLLGLYCFTLPKTPPPSRGERTSWRQISGLDALKQVRSKPLIVLLVSATLAYVGFGTYFPYAPVYLADAGIEKVAGTMTLGQMSEIFFMLMIPFFFRRLGVKWMLFIGIAAWFVRFGLFGAAAVDGVYWMIPGFHFIDQATGSILGAVAVDGVYWMILFGILIHGLCYDFFFVTAQIYVDKKTPAAIRGQIQGLLVLLTFGLGMFLGAQISGAVVGWVSDSDVISSPEQWRSFWGVFAAAMLVFSAFFFLLFRDKVGTEDVKATEDVEPAF